MNTDYGLREPTDEEIAVAFGNLTHAVVKTGGDIGLLCFYIANPDRIERAPIQVCDKTTFYARALALRADRDLAVRLFKQAGARCAMALMGIGRRKFRKYIGIPFGVSFIKFAEQLSATPESNT